jgi:hypothetical protein
MIKPSHIPQHIWDDMSVHCEERDGNIVRDGQRISRAVTFMDGAPPSMFLTDAALPALAHRPQSFPMNVTDASDLAKLRADAEAKLNDAWRNPGPVAVADVGATQRPSAPAFDASMSLDALRAEATNRLVESWRHP